MEEKAVLPNGETVFQCCATLTLIWLSGSALLSCQPVLKGAADVFGCLCRAKKRCRDGEHAALVPGLWHTGPPSPDSHFSSISFSFPALTFLLGDFLFTLFPFCFCYSPPLRLPLSLFLTSRDKHTHTTHTDSFLSKTHFRSYECVVWKESKCSLVYLCFFSPQIHRQDAVLLTSNGFDVFFLIDVSVT